MKAATQHGTCAASLTAALLAHCVLAQLKQQTTWEPMGSWWKDSWSGVKPRITQA